MKQKKIKLNKKGLKNRKGKIKGLNNPVLKSFVANGGIANGSATVGITASASFINGEDVDTFTDTNS